MINVRTDRKPNHRVRRAYQRLTTAFGVRLAAWAGATHNAHFDHPETLAAVREVVTRVS